MKKVGSMLLMGAMVISLAGCGGQSAESTTAAETKAESGETTAADSSDDLKESESEKEDQKAEEDGKEAAGENGTFIVGFDQDFPPMGFVGNDGEYTGFDLELAEEVANRLGMEFVPQPIAWDAKDMELNSGTIPILLS